MKLHFLILLFYSSLCFAQDSPNIQYSIIQIEFFEDHNIIKIKVPGWLKTSELMEQLQYLVIWPNEPPPTKIIYIYVFKETDQIGDTSETGCIYIPQKGFIWNLNKWQPKSGMVVVPSDSELTIYNTLVDSILKQGSTINNRELRFEIARRFNLTLRQLDSIYTKVKHWQEFIKKYK